MTTRELDPVRFARLVRGVVLQHYAVRSCIETLRCAVTVGRYFGLAIEPVPVQVIYATADWWDWPADDKTNAPGWSVGTPGTGRIYPAANSWDGHLMGWWAAAAGPGLLIDFSADMYHRPAKGLNVDGPVALTVGRDELAAGLTMRRPGSNLVCYVQEIDSDYWRRAPGWVRFPAHARKAAGQAIREVRAAQSPTGATP